MYSHITTGRLGEAIAARWLAQKGFSILHRNWRSGRLEIDLVACKESCLHFIEVKTRTNLSYGYPEQAVTRQKMMRMQQAADIFLQQQPHYKLIRFDVLAITVCSHQVTEIFLFEDVYF
ncbi:MAG: YraN family protein [Chitinophagaceae bacterium]|jgi:putative endonuclease|nr:YraN family protein [Chitinophagaceae bacterium]